jgi:hypothetical protein
VTKQIEVIFEGSAFELSEALLHQWCVSAHFQAPSQSMAAVIHKTTWPDDWYLDKPYRKPFPLRQMLFYSFNRVLICIPP